MSEPAPGATRHCIKCGREIGADETICAVCNRAGMATPSATQYHGTVVVAIVGAVAALAIAASLAMRGVGPFHGEATAFRTVAGNTVEVTLSVTNQGTKAGRTKCLLAALDASGRQLQQANIVSDAMIPPGAAVTLEERIPGVPQPPARVTASCE